MNKIVDQSLELLPGRRALPGFAEDLNELGNPSFRDDDLALPVTGSGFVGLIGAKHEEENYTAKDEVEEGIFPDGFHV